MKIAVTYENGQVFQHFGHTKQFKVYETADGKVVSSEIVGTQGQGHGALAGFLLGGGVDVLICGGIGGGARAALAEAGIRLFPGASGDFLVYLPKQYLFVIELHAYYKNLF